VLTTATSAAAACAVAAGRAAAASPTASSIPACFSAAAGSRMASRRRSGSHGRALPGASAARPAASSPSRAASCGSVSASSVCMSSPHMSDCKPQKHTSGSEVVERWHVAEAVDEAEKISQAAQRCEAQLAARCRTLLYLQGPLLGTTRQDLGDDVVRTLTWAAMSRACAIAAAPPWPAAARCMRGLPAKPARISQAVSTMRHSRPLARNADASFPAAPPLLGCRCCRKASEPPQRAHQP